MIPGAILPGFTGAFIQHVVEGGSSSLAALLIGGILLLLVLQVAISWLQAYSLNRLVFRMFLVQSSRMAKRLLTHCGNFIGDQSLNWLWNVYGAANNLFQAPPLLRTRGDTTGDGVRKGLLGRGISSHSAWETLVRAKQTCLASARTVVGRVHF